MEMNINKTGTEDTTRRLDPIVRDITACVLLVYRVQWRTEDNRYNTYFIHVQFRCNM